MAAKKSDRDEWPIRRAAMLAMRRNGKTYEQIARKFGVSRQTARTIIVRLLSIAGIPDPKMSKHDRQPQADRQVSI